MAKKKTKYPADREQKSNLIKKGLVSFSHYTTAPATDISIRASLSNEAKEDIEAAIDDVLSFHGL